MLQNEEQNSAIVHHSRLALQKNTEKGGLTEDNEKHQVVNLCTHIM